MRKSATVSGRLLFDPVTGKLMRYLTNGKLTKISLCEIDFASSPNQWISGKTANVTLEWRGYLVDSLALSSGNPLVTLSPSEITQGQFGERNIYDKYSVSLPWSYTMAAGTSAALTVPRASNVNADSLYNFEYNSVVPDYNFTFHYPGLYIPDAVGSPGSWYEAGPPEASGEYTVFTDTTFSEATVVMTPPDQSAVGLFVYYNGVSTVDVTTSYRVTGTPPPGYTLPESTTVTIPCSSTMRFIPFINYPDGTDDGSAWSVLFDAGAASGGWTRESLNGVGVYTPNYPSQPSASVS